MKVNLQEAISLLKAGGVVALPTETVYGLAASLHADAAIDQIFHLKNRPQDNPLIVHIACFEQLKEITSCPFSDVQILAEAFWPGPLTLVLPAIIDNVPLKVRAGLLTVGVRMPAHPLTLEVIRQVGPIVAPSANLSGRPSSTSSSHIAEDFGPMQPVLEGGKCKKGIESTILIQTEEGWQLGRLGAIPIEAIEETLGYVLKQRKDKKILCPGQHYRHYSPKARLIFGKGAYEGDPPVVLGFLDLPYPGAKKIYALGNKEDVSTIQANLYRTLRELDRDGVTMAWVDANFDQDGPLRTVFERLSKAASG